MVASGDIVNDTAVAERTGEVAAAQQPALVLTLGDNQYSKGTLAQYRAEYDRSSWGRLKAITNPVPGNHEYQTRRAAGYFAYFDNPPPYYAYDGGCGWRGYALNSEIELTEQLAWLRRDLAEHPDVPVLAAWHTPRYSSGTEHGNNPQVQPLVDALAGRTGIVLNGHEHNYERFAPVGGLREFVVGTGGTSDYPFGAPVVGSEQRIADTPGVLRLDLQPAGYTWAFLDSDNTSLDQGSQTEVAPASS
ncbi:MAG: metallophosphoesterase family protein [Sporichthyaceae bacterium]